MRKPFVAALAAVVGLLAVTGLSACAGMGEAREDVVSITPGVDSSLTGVVTRIGNDQLVVYSPDHPEQPNITFRRTGATEVMKDKQQADFSAISEGTPVRVSFDLAPGSEEVKRVEILSGDEANKVINESGQQQQKGQQPGGGYQGGQYDPSGAQE